MYGAHCDLHALTHSFPTRRSSVLASAYGHLDTVIGLVNWIGQLINITCSCQQTKAQQVLVKIKITVIGGSVKGFYIKFFGQKCQVQQAAGILYKNMHRSEENTSELQSLMRISYAVFCLKKK